MKRIVAVALLVVGLLMGGIAGSVGPAAASQEATTDCSFPVSATDASGTNVTIEAEPSSVVALHPSAAQTMWEIGAREKVVGLPKNAYTAYLNDTAAMTDVAGEQSTVLQEEVVRLDPDLVLAPNVTDNGTVESLRNADQTVYYVREATSLRDVYEKTELTGRLVGEFPAAASRTAEMRGTVRAVQNAIESEDRPGVYYVLGGGYTAGSGTFIDELITTAGGENIAASAGVSGWDTLNQEVIVNGNPEWIVVPEGVPLPRNDAMNRTTAIREDQIVRVNDNYMNQAGPRNTVPLLRMAEAFHPDVDVAGAVANADVPAPTQCDIVTAADDDSTDSNLTSGETTTSTPTAGTPAANGPGFTAVLAMFGVALATLAAARTQFRSRR